MRIFISIAVWLFVGIPAIAQTAPETLAYLLFGITVPPNNEPPSRTDIIKSTPISFHFVSFFTGNKNEYNSENVNVVIEQISTCNFRITGKLRRNDEFIDMDNTLDFTAMSGSDPKFITEKAASKGFWDRYYYKIEGVKACARKGSFKTKDFYHQFPAENQCSDYIHTINVFNNDHAVRMTAAYKYFKQTYCKGRAF